MASPISSTMWGHSSRKRSAISCKSSRSPSTRSSAFDKSKTLASMVEESMWESLLKLFITYLQARLRPDCFADRHVKNVLSTPSRLLFERLYRRFCEKLHL